MMYKQLSILYFFFISLPLISQEIKTVQLHPYGNEAAQPIVPLGSVLDLSFDDLEADNKDYQYKIEHMTYDWKPSNLQSNQYINGFDQNYIINITNSFNTLQSYTHYNVQIPNQNTIITKSGNYIISVLDDDDNVLFTRRCVFYENLTTVGVNVLRSRETLNNNTEQTVQFIINHQGLSINNPFQEIQVQLFQNNNWNTTVTNIPPLFIRTDRLIYNYTQKTNFLGGNEFLNFDNKYIRNTNVNIAKTTREDLFHNYLYTDIDRTYKPYTYNPDINGNFIIRTLDAEDENTEADYAMMHFSLEVDEPYRNKDVYVYGAFNNYELTDSNKMTYNSSENTYEASILLKQGFYNYMYVTANKNKEVNLTEISGSFFQTENEYTVIVYYKPFGALFYRAIGVGNGFFNQNR
ncbi:type IX secretion system plug protein [Tenacibaculum amylolyticum]|uniref:type IX secretion system plug protein n=1 Tax=Tenacibaculum amylolyticum TaxID=104269 RepID=UPI0038B442E6